MFFTIVEKEQIAGDFLFRSRLEKCENQESLGCQSLGKTSGAFNIFL